MAKIKRAVRERYPESEALLPTLIYHRTDVQFDQAIKDAELCVEHTDSGCNPSVRDHLVVGEDGIKRVDPSKRG